jgi:predicted O-linked N-acetylglucosamine transferase (SPINDLY family)
MSQLSIPQAFNLALQHQQAGRLGQAETLYRQILAVQPDHAEALHLLGLIAFDAHRFAEGEDYLRRAIALAPNQPHYCFNLGHNLLQRNRPAEAIDLLRRALQLDPTLVDAWVDLGGVLHALGQIPAAAEAYQNAAHLRPDDPGILNCLGNVLRALGKPAEAEQCFLHALQIQPDMFETLGNLGTFYESLGRFGDALVLADRALALAPNHPLLHYNRAIALNELNRVPEAIDAYQKALQLKPDYIQAHNNLGNIYKSKGRVDEAIDAFRRALQINPDFVEALCNLATLLQSLGRGDEALVIFRRALALCPQSAVTHSNLIYALLFHPQYDAAAIRDELSQWNERHARPLARLIQPHTNDRNPNRRLRIGYVSPDFREHVIARNVLPIFQNRDREAFEVFCYSNLTVQDATTLKFRQLSDHWRDVRTIPPEQLAALIRADGIDILVDLALHMAGNSLLTFACKPAPIQVTFAGYPGSAGLTAIDYRLSDPYLDRPEHDAFYVEKTIRLPHSFWCFDSAEKTLTPNPLPAATTTPPGLITFGCLNTFGKTNEPTFDLWSQILRNVPNSRLLLLCPEGSHRQRTLAFFQARDIAPDRIRFSPFLAHRKYLELYHQIDLCLDTLPYNGHSTSLDALWMGVPVVTLVGNTVVGRAGLSQLMNLSLPELVTYTPQQFITTATELAQDLPRLQNYRSTLRRRMEQSPLMDPVSFTRDIESAFHTMWTSWCTSPADPTKSLS